MKKIKILIPLLTILLGFLTAANVTAEESDSVLLRPTPNHTPHSEPTRGRDKEKPDKKDYKGTIAAVDTGSLTLTLKDGSSLGFILTAETKINITGLGRGATVADLKAGDDATVRATTDESGALVADKIDVKPVQPELDHYTGTVTDYEEAVSITIREKKGTPQSFRITSETKITFDPKDQEQILEVGSEVTIAAVRDTSAGTPAAKEIAVKKPKAEKPKDYKGTIAVVEAGSLTLTLNEGSSLVFVLNAETRIKITGLKNATVADLEVGDSATVHAAKDDTGALTASQVEVKIKVKHFKGTVTDYQEGASLTILEKNGTSRTFLITAETRIKFGKKDQDNTLQVGSEVTVVAPLDPAGGTLTATEITVHPAKKNYRGTIAAVDAGSLTLTQKDGSTLAFILNADTKVSVPGLGRNATLADLVVGEYVTVRAALDESGAWVAGEVHVAPNKPDKVHRVGIVIDYQPGVSITIRDREGVEFVFRLTADTKILPSEHAGQLTVGSRVTIITPRDVTGGGLTALAIVIHPAQAGGTATPTVTATATETPTSEPVLEATATATEAVYPSP
ncbi:MAG: DUF5666 domain-containing protein [Anaerolineales bacterium]